MPAATAASNTRLGTAARQSRPQPPTHQPVGEASRHCRTGDAAPRSPAARRRSAQAEHPKAAVHPVPPTSRQQPPPLAPPRARRSPLPPSTPAAARAATQSAQRAPRLAHCTEEPPVSHLPAVDAATIQQVCRRHSSGSSRPLKGSPGEASAASAEGGRPRCHAFLVP